MSRTRRLTPVAPPVRCAIYTRKSTEEGLGQEFNTLDAQRESGGSSAGWPCRYAGKSGGGWNPPRTSAVLPAMSMDVASSK